MKRVILDVGTGLEDALAILFAVKSKEISLEGVTTGFGNVGIEKSHKMVSNVLKLSGTSTDIPVIIGAATPLNTRVAAYKDGVKDEAADFIVHKVKEHPGEITLVSVGGLTNVALALAKDPSIATKIERVVVRGGVLKIPGDVTPVSEATIHRDPEAAHRVFESGVRITMVGLDAIRQINNQAEYVEEMLRALSLDQKQFAQLDRGQHPLHGLLATAVVSDPSYMATEDFYVYVETKGVTSLGATLVDLRYPQEQTNASVCMSVDEKRFIAHLNGEVS